MLDAVIAPSASVRLSVCLSAANIKSAGEEHKKKKFALSDGLRELGTGRFAKAGL